MTETYWNGLPVTAVRGSAIVAKAPEFVYFWGAHLIGQRIEVVRVKSDTGFGGFVYIDNRDESGWHKVTTGKGYSDFTHRHLNILQDSFIEED